MRIYDVSLKISPDLPVWPGDPRIALERVSKIEKGASANVTRMDISVHTGTHVDAPFHFLPDGRSVESLPLDTLTGRAYVVHLPEVDLITREVLARIDLPPRTRRVLFRTRNSERWSEGITEFDKNYVALDAEGSRYLIERGVQLVGVDGLSVAPFTDLVDTHNILLKAGVVIVEGLDLSQVAQGYYSLYCLPLKIAGSDGAPARTILISDEDQDVG